MKTSGAEMLCVKVMIFTKNAYMHIYAAIFMFLFTQCFDSVMEVKVSLGNPLATSHGE